MVKRQGSGRATINDVARQAEVGSTSVSRFLRDPSVLSVKLQEKIRKAIEELNYIPDPKARALASGYSNVIGVLIPSFSNIVFSDILKGIHDAVEGTPYQVQIANTRYDTAEEDRLISLFVGQKPRALILTGVDQSTRSRDLLKERGFPVVQILDKTDDPIDMVIGFSHEQAATSVIQHLFQKGYKKIACIAARMDERVNRRLTGYRDCLRKLNAYDNNLEFLSVEASSAQLGRKLMADALDGKGNFDAVFCFNDDLALGAFFECQARGISVPQDMGIVGFNDLEMMAAAYPSLTSIRTNRYEIGKQAVERILQSIDGDRETESQYDIGFSLIERQSTQRN